MAKKVYIGVNNVARKVKKIYIGVGGVARKVKKGYIGVNGVARLFYTSGPSTIGELPLGTKVMAGTYAYTVVAQNHNLLDSNYPANCTTIWSNTKTGTTSPPDYSSSHVCTNAVLDGLTAGLQKSTTISFKFISTVQSRTGTRFILPTTELGFSLPSAAGNGVAMPYFTSNTQRAKGSSYWTPNRYSSNRYYVNTTGGYSSTTSTSSSYCYYYAGNIPMSTAVNPEPNADGSYNLII